VKRRRVELGLVEVEVSVPQARVQLYRLQE
jgi:hypothetical protein